MDAEAYRARVKEVGRALTAEEVERVDQMIKENADYGRQVCGIKCIQSAAAAVKKYMIGKGFVIVRDALIRDGTAELFFE